MGHSLQNPEIAEVIIDKGIDDHLDYKIPEQLLPLLSIGSRVIVPVRSSLREGFVVKLKSESKFKKLREIKEEIAEEYSISQEIMDLAQWIAKYYCTPLHKVLKTMLPAAIREQVKEKEQLYVTRHKTREHLRQLCVEIRSRYPAQASVLDVILKVKKGILLSDLCEQSSTTQGPVQTLVKKGVLKCEKVVVDRSPLQDAEYFPTFPKTLTVPQETSFKKISLSIEENRHETYLLHGVTGSGKTEIYLQTIDLVLSKGKSAIVLVPEIALTTQTIERFKSRFTCPISILHCRLNNGERRDEWVRIKKGISRIVIGARSAIFAPVQDLGIIVVDEEHEQTYKNEEMPTYNGRDVAIVRGHAKHCPVILGTATPSLESYLKAKEGKYTLLKLQERADGSKLPKVNIVDMKREYQKNKGLTIFSEELLNKLKKVYTNGEQALLFLNRRGYHTSLLCGECGNIEGCSNCSVSLSYHKEYNSLRCHLCGLEKRPPPLYCSHCNKETRLKFKGVGTEQVERTLHAIFPDIRTMRMDADTTRHKGSHEKFFKAFRSGKADVLIGTQMIAKGLHFPEITLVGVLNHDSSLHFPDFRSGEYTFQVLTQVAGRAGRGVLKGEVIIQTTLPEHPLVELASTQDYPRFFDEEICGRRLLKFPPFVRIVKLIFSCEDETICQEYGDFMISNLSSSLSNSYHIHRTMACGYAKIKGRYRYQSLIRGPNPYTITKAIQSTLKKRPLPKKLKLVIDVDPTSTFF